MPKERVKPAQLNGEKARGKAKKEKAPAQLQPVLAKKSHEQPAPAAQPKAASMRGPLSAEVRQRLEAALAEERLETHLFGPSGRAETITISVTPAILNDLAFLAGYFEHGYGHGRRTNKSALVRLAIRTLRYWLDPTGMPPDSQLPFDAPDSVPVYSPPLAGGDRPSSAVEV